LSAELPKTHSYRLFFFWQFCPLGNFWVIIDGVSAPGYNMIVKGFGLTSMHMMLFVMPSIRMLKQCRSNVDQENLK